MDREPGKEILTVENLSKTVDGVKVLNNVSFRIEKGEKVAFVGENEIATTTLFQILMGEIYAERPYRNLSARIFGPDAFFW